MIIKRNCLFLLDKEKDKTDAKLRYRIKWEGNTVAFNVGYRVEVSKWISEAQRCKSNTYHGKKKVSAAIINRQISHYEELADEVFYTFEQNGTSPTEEEFRNAFNLKLGKIEEKGKSLYEYYDEFIIKERKEKSWTDSTYRKHRTVKKHIQNFAPNLEFSDLTEDGLNKLTDYMLSITDDTGNPSLKNTTIKKDINIFKWFLRWATKMGYNKELAYETYKPKLKTIPRKVIYLTWDELMAIKDTSIPEEMGYLAKIKDMLLFCCFTSLRFSDMQNLKWSYVFDNHIEVTTIKTNDPLRIELNKYSKEVLTRYIRTKGYVFPRISNQKMNDYLKTLGKLCNIDAPTTITYYKGNERIEEILPKYELLSSHIGRRTFICNALMLGIAPNIVMKWTGHSDYAAMKPYIEIADKAKETAMSLFNKI